MSGFTPGTPEFNAAVAYYADLHYKDPSLLAKNGLLYYTDSPARRWIAVESAKSGSTKIPGQYRGNISGIIYDHYDSAPDIDSYGPYWGGSVNGYMEPLTVIREPGAVINPYYDPNFNIASIPLREGESFYFEPYDANAAYSGYWVLDSPATQVITRGLNWSDWRAGIEYVGTVIGLAIIGGELLAPEAAPVVADVAPLADIAPAVVDIAPVADIAPAVVDIAPVADIAPAVVDIAPVADITPAVVDIAPVADIAPAVVDIAPVADIAPAVADVATPSLTELASNVKSVVGTVTTVEKLLNPTPPRPIQNVNPPSVQVPSPSPDASGEIPVVALLGLLLFKVF